MSSFYKGVGNGDSTTLSPSTRCWEVSKRSTTTYFASVLLQIPELSHGKFGVEIMIHLELWKWGLFFPKESIMIFFVFVILRKCKGLWKLEWVFLNFSGILSIWPSSVACLDYGYCIFKALVAAKANAWCMTCPYFRTLTLLYYSFSCYELQLSWSATKTSELAKMWLGKLNTQSWAL